MSESERAIAYLRSSTADEDAVERQRAEIRAWAEGRHVEIEREVVERGPATGRPALESLIAALAGDPDVIVVVLDPTRLTRFAEGLPGELADKIVFVCPMSGFPREGHSNTNESTR